MRRPDMRALATILLLTCAAGCALPEVRPLTEGPTPGPSPYGPWYEQHWQVNAVMLEPADADTMAAIEQDAAAEDAYADEAYADEAYVDSGDPAIPPDDSYEPLPASEPGAAEPYRGADDGYDPSPEQPRRPARGTDSGEPVRY